MGRARFDREEMLAKDEEITREESREKDNARQNRDWSIDAMDGEKKTARSAHMSHRREHLYELCYSSSIVNGKIHSFFVLDVMNIKRQFKRNYTLDFEIYNVHLIHNNIVIFIIFNEYLFISSYENSQWPPVCQNLLLKGS